MNNSAYYLSIPNLLLIFIPVVIVMTIYIRWSLGFKTLLYAAGRMVIQLILVGYALIVIFNQSDVLVSGCVLIMMMVVSSWIALRPIKQFRKQYYLRTLLSLVLGGIPVLALVIIGVVKLTPWYLPRYLIPLAGMIFCQWHE